MGAFDTLCFFKMCIRTERGTESISILQTIERVRSQTRSENGLSPIHRVAIALYFDVWVEEIKNPNFGKEIKALLELKEKCLLRQLETSSPPVTQAPNFS